MKFRLLLALALLMLMTGPLLAQQQHPTATLAFKLLSTMPEGDNAVVSPMSLELAFAMAASGAEGATRSEMLGALGLGDDFLEVCKTDMAALNVSGAEVSVANRLWPSSHFRLSSQFLAQCLDVFGARPKTLDYGKTEQARQEINGWVAEITKQKIPHLIPKGMLGSGTLLVLSNALYFKGSWKEPFQPGFTVESSFQAPGGPVPVMMMFQLKPHEYLETPEWQAVRLAYGDSGLSMTLVVPRRADGWKELRKSFDPKALQGLQYGENERGEPTSVELRMPRFKLRANLPVIRSMRALGMKLPFQPGADFSKMGQGGLYISDAVHEAVVEVDEAGTVGAAATAIVSTRSLSIGRPGPRVVADHPFLFVIGDAAGRTLFVGQVVKPAP
jgi:serpin B